MKKKLILIIFIFLVGCSKNKNLENIPENTENDYSSFSVSNNDWYFYLNGDKKGSSESFLTYIYENEKNLNIGLYKENLEKIKNISKFNGETLKFEIGKNVFSKEFLDYLAGAKGEKLEIVKNFKMDEKNVFLDINLEEAKVLKSLDFKEKEIILVQIGTQKPRCNQEVFKIIPEICEK